MKKTIYTSYVIILIALFFYSYTQIDLSLTFSRIEILRELVKSFQYIGYFNRPLSAFIYILLIILFFNIYLGFLVMARTGQINQKNAWKLIIISAFILAFSYNAFSHDLFNYIFDAKIVTYYHQNPYLHKALDFSADPMLSFMHWTHRTYPYGPAWLVLTVPLSFLGFNFFIPTFVFFKLLMTLGYLGTTYYIGKILQKISPKDYLWGIIFFALNPLVIIESLVSAHLDIVMLFFAVWSLYQLIRKKYFLAFSLLIVSSGIKFVTGALLPIYLLIVFLQRKNNPPAGGINWLIILIVSLLLMTSTVIYASGLTNFQPWYLIETLFIASLLSYKYYVFIPSVIISFFALLTYAPYLYLGNWDPPVPSILSGLYIFSYGISLFAVAGYYIHKKAQIAKIKSKNHNSNLKSKIDKL